LFLLLRLLVPEPPGVDRGIHVMQRKTLPGNDKTALQRAGSPSLPAEPEHRP
jgi:hypothetical protein